MTEVQAMEGSLIVIGVLTCALLHNWAKANKPKIVNSKVVLQTIEANLASSTLRVPGELGVSQSSVVDRLYDLGS